MFCFINHTQSTQTDMHYIEMLRPGLKVETSEAVMDPEAVMVTFGAISRIKHAETTPLLPTLALRVPIGAV